MLNGECQTFVSDCHVRAAAALLSHSWDPIVLSALRRGPLRRHDLLTGIGGISDKVLTESLRRLRSRALITRAAEPGGGASYRLSPLGESLAEGPLAALAQWAADHQSDLV
ncbi:HxlR family transcriptional regulator [Actinoplanes ianthinogenes]|uniref:HxlR family transcriptional regulator n=1 Tax=Actinoplanes ianthinogenes TaxID=122358 RepID=A0ABM7LNP3_9ACTN|nr:helix-turn-helix domain-containing protein [Actinoplanes ianthinogenes]BCJ40820.1 HxlR family transcriptional regulator [Actinoplanes ianthinogenes]GGR24990.1 HxlR family transcriptional regulator [Actinoplanes ianthinogenes]